MNNALEAIYGAISRLLFLVLKIIFEGSFALILAYSAFLALQNRFGTTQILPGLMTYGTIPAILFGIALYKGWCWSISEDRIRA